MPEYAASKLTGGRCDAYFPSFSGIGNSRPQWGQITVSPGFHSFPFATFVEAHEERRNRTQSSGSNGLANRLIAGLPAPFFPRGTFRGAAQLPYYNRRRFHEAETWGVRWETANCWSSSRTWPAGAARSSGKATGVGRRSTSRGRSTL